MIHLSYFFSLWHMTMKFDFHCRLFVPLSTYCRLFWILCLKPPLEKDMNMIFSHTSLELWIDRVKFYLTSLICSLLPDGIFWNSLLKVSIHDLKVTEYLHLKFSINGFKVLACAFRGWDKGSFLIWTFVSRTINFLSSRTITFVSRTTHF